MVNNISGKKPPALPVDGNGRALAGLCLPLVDGTGHIIGWAPAGAVDQGDGTLVLKVDAELAVDNANFTFNNLKVGSIDQTAANSRYLKTDADGTVHVTVVGTPTADTNIIKWGGTVLTGANITPNILNLDVALSTRATEATLASVKTDLDSILARLDVALSTRATEATLGLVKTDLDDVKTKLDTLNAKDFSTQTTLAQVKTDLDSILAQLNVTLSTRASESTLGAVKSDLDDIKTKLDTLNAKDFATQTTLLSLNSKDFATQTTLAGIKTQTDKLTFAGIRLLVDGSGVTQPISAVSLPLPTGAATETTLTSVKTDLDEIALDTDNLSLIKVKTDNLDIALSTRLADATFTGRINTQGQKTMAASTPVVLASDQSAISVSVANATASSVTVVARSASSVTLLASNSSRRGAIIHNDASTDLFVKLGATASTSSFTTRLGAQDSYEVPFRYSGIIDGIWASAGAGDAKITELT